MGYGPVWVTNKPEDAFLIPIFGGLIIIGIICSCIKSIWNSISPGLIKAGEWMISLHGGNLFECVFHFYLWIVIVPIVALALIGVAGVIGGVIAGIGGAFKLTSLITFEPGFMMLVAPIVVGLFLGAIGLVLGGVIGAYVILLPAFLLLHSYWELILLFKEKVLHMGWCDDIFFGILIFAIVPGLLLTGFLMTK